MEKLNNLLSFSEFEKTWKPEEQKKTKKTDLGLDVIKEKVEDVFSEKGKDGQWIISAIIDGTRVHKQYFDYTKSEAIKKFKNEHKSKKNEIIKEENTGNWPVPASLRGKTHLPDNDSWTNRFEIKSESSDRIYIVSQNKNTGEWGCSCPGWRIMKNGVRKCKHLSSLGLLGAGVKNKELER